MALNKEEKEEEGPHRCPSSLRPDGGRNLGAFSVLHQTKNDDEVKKSPHLPCTRFVQLNAM